MVSQPTDPPPAAAGPPPLARELVARITRDLGAMMARRGARGDHRDLVQSAWLRLLERLDAFEGRSSLDSYAHGVGRVVYREELRKEARRRRLEERWTIDRREAVHPAPDEPRARGARNDRLEAALAQLGERDRWLLETRAARDASYPQLLADFRARFGASISTPEGLRTAYFHARRRVLRALDTAVYGGPAVG